MKKLLPLLICPLLLITSCSAFSDDNKVLLAANIDTYLDEKTNNYLDPDINYISSNLRMNANIIVYFTNTGCSSCESFSPIMDDYVLHNNAMVYKFDIDNNREQFNMFKEEYGQMFFGSNTESISLPALYVVNEGKVEQVKYDSYMKTQLAFNNYMNKHYKVSNAYYTMGDVFKRDFVDKEFAYINFNSSNLTLKDIYTNRLDSKAKSSQRKVIISDFNQDNVIHLRLTGRNALGNEYSIKEYVVTNETSIETISTVL